MFDRFRLSDQFRSNADQINDFDLLHEAGISQCTTKLCDRYQFSAAMTFLSWFISTA
ncbi:hypothetical protein MTR_5g015510 [Medicago truncatula]|uniref:Uncharacterized protein n=1 Tax=Medicago truncatula TaxID=3880 RepID=G7K2I7_MEDTR|nr:hypothetical protein MTR_5g015510 [Medicago truncatula]